MLATFKKLDSAKQKYTKTQPNEICFTLAHTPSMERDYLVIRYFITYKCASKQCRNVKSQWKTTWSAIQAKNDNVNLQKKAISYSVQDNKCGFKLNGIENKIHTAYIIKKSGGNMTNEWDHQALSTKYGIYSTIYCFCGSVGIIYSVLHTAGQKEPRLSFMTKYVSYHSVTCEIRLYDLHVKHLCTQQNLKSGFNSLRVKMNTYPEYIWESLVKC